MRHRPQRAQGTQIVEWENGVQRRRLDELAGEEPLEIRLNGAPLAVTMRTPGDDFELAAGFLVTEAVVRDRAGIRRVSYGRGGDGQVSGNIVEVEGEPLGDQDAAHVERRFVSSSSCGVCGKASIDAIRARDLARPNPDARIDARVLCRLPGVLRVRQTVFGRTGGLHAAALFDTAGELVDAREDIGRHNAVDKVVGRAWFDDRLPLANHALVVSGRAGFEIVQKAVAAGIPIVASVSAPSSLAVRLAREFDLTLIGFLRGSRFVIYSGERRLADAAPEGVPGVAGRIAAG
jgi:FdhD protein